MSKVNSANSIDMSSALSYSTEAVGSRDDPIIIDLSHSDPSGTLLEEIMSAYPVSAMTSEDAIAHFHPQLQLYPYTEPSQREANKYGDVLMLYCYITSDLPTRLRMQLYETLGKTIRRESLRFPYNSDAPNCGAVVMHDNLSIRNDPAYCIVSGCRDCRMARENVTSMKQMNIVTGILHTAWLDQLATGMRHSREIPWHLIRWNDVARASRSAVGKSKNLCRHMRQGKVTQWDSPLLHILMGQKALSEVNVNALLDEEVLLRQDPSLVPEGGRTIVIPHTKSGSTIYTPVILNYREYLDVLTRQASIQHETYEEVYWIAIFIFGLGPLFDTRLTEEPTGTIHVTLLHSVAVATELTLLSSMAEGADVAVENLAVCTSSSYLRSCVLLLEQLMQAASPDDITAESKENILQFSSAIERHLE